MQGEIATFTVEDIANYSREMQKDMAAWLHNLAYMVEDNASNMSSPFIARFMERKDIWKEGARD